MHRRLLKRIVFGWLLLVVLVALLGKVTVAASNAGETGADFLLIGMGASSAGMAGAYTAVAGGVAASYWNPAGLTSVTAGEALLGHFAWYQDIKVEHGAVARRIHNQAVVAFSMTYLSYGTIERYDAFGYSTGEVSAYDWVGVLSVGYSLSEKLSVGFSSKLISQRLDDISGSSYALDIGVKYTTEKYGLAAVLANIGPDIQFDYVKERLPITSRIGFYLYPFRSPFISSIELERRAVGDIILHQGFQMAFRDRYYVRTGYSFYASSDVRSFGNGVSIGVGAEFDKFTIDYSFTPGDKYTSDNLHRFSVVFAFGE
jgi:hypothetical protein